MGSTWHDAMSDGLKGYRQYVLERDRQVASFLEFDPSRSNNANASNPAAPNPNNNPNDGRADAAVQPALVGLPFAVKDNIAVRGFHLTCGSKILANFVSPYSATAVEKLQAAGAKPVGKTNMDEFGMGSSTDNSAFKQTNNPWDQSRVAGGSSGGSAAAVAAGLVPFALGSDTGGSVRQPAAFCGVYGLKPTYGSVSRYGLVAYASSLEVIGVMARDVGLVKTVFETIKGPDVMDNTTIEPADFPVTKTEVKTIGVLKGLSGLDPSVQKAYDQTKDALVGLGFKLVEVELPMLEYSVPAYYTIASAEASANLARYNGIRYGDRPIYSENPDSLVRQARDNGFGDEVKLRILTGTYVLRSGFQEQFYQKAQKIRTAIKNDFERVFGQADVLLMPVFPVPAFKHGDAGMDQFQQKVADKFTTAANLSGHPGLAVPGPVVDGLPVGMQFMAPAMHEDLLFHVAQKLAPVFPAQTPPAFPAVYS
jgi:aspartyl-tRNA(Asn)/glutamyl-tRNA(Gln) amidotransferase subunit A